MLGQAPLGPPPGAFQSLFLIGTGVEQGRELVEGHHDVGPQPVLDRHRDLRGEPVQVAVERAAEGDTTVVDHGLAVPIGCDDVGLGELGDVHGKGLLEPGPQAQHLEPSGVGESGAIPGHEPAHSPGLVHQIGARLQEEVVGIGQHGLGTQIGELIGGERLDAGLGAHDDERRGRDVAVRGVDDAGTPQPVVQP